MSKTFPCHNLKLVVELWQGGDSVKNGKEVKIELIVVLTVIVCVTAYLIIYGVSDLNTKIKEDNSKIAELQSKVTSKEEIIKDKNEQIKELGKSDKQYEINQTINTLENKVKDLISQKEKLEKDIENLKSDVIKIKGEPKQYPAGQLTAGTDVPTGKYKIYGGNSNFVVYSSYGKLKVNVILGTSIGVDEYIYTFETGDKIKAESSFKLVAVE